MRNLSPALIVMVALGMGAMQWAQSQGLSSIDASEMRLAVKTGDAGRVRTLIQRGVDANAKDADGYTPLHQAAVDGFPEAVDALLATTPKPDVDAKTNNGYTALHLAAAGGTQGHLKVVEALLEADATIDEEAPGERTALHIAAWGGHAEVVEALLDEDATVDEKATGGWTPLHLAAHGTMQGHLDSVQALLDEGADRNIEAQERKPWQYAWERKQRAIVDILNPLIPSALINAVADDDVDEVRDLIAAGYSAVNEKNSIGQSTVYLAVVRKHRGVLQALLVADDIDVNVKGLGGYAALHLAAYYQDSDADTPTGRNLLGLVTDLIAADGVDVNLVGGTSLGAYRPLTIAIDRDNDKAERVLRDAGATGIPTGTLAFSPTATLAVPEGGTANLGVKLSVKPDTNVSVIVSAVKITLPITNPTPPEGGPISISKTNITFTPSNWDTAQTIAVTGNVIDEDAVDTEGLSINFYTTSNAGFKFSSSEIVKSVKIDDKDEVGFVASRTGTRDNRLQIREGQYIEETFRLSSKPTATITLELNFSFCTPGYPFENSLHNTEFTPQNWNVPQKVKITAKHDDNSVDECYGMFYHTVDNEDEENEYDEAALWFHLVSKDDDVPEPIFVPFESPTIAEGTTKTITLRMGTQPVANPKGADCSVGSHSSPCIQAIVNYRKLPALSISYPTGNNPTWTVVSTASFNQGRTIFNENNWNSPQTITLTAPEDSNTSDESRDIAVSLYGVGYSSGGTLGYDNPQVTNYTVKVMDDDVQGEILFASGLEVSEGGVSTLSVSLSAKPRQPIQIGASSTLSRISLVPASFTIAPENWNKGRNVVVRSRDEEADNIRDADDESGQITMTTGDGLTTLSTTKNFTETDPEVEGAIEDRNKITLDGKVKVSEGGPGKIFVKLDTKPEYNTTLNIARSNNKLTVPASLTFTPQNWSDEQEILFRAGYDSGTNNASTTLTLSTTGGLITSPVTIPVDIISAGVHRYLFFIFNVAGETFKTSERFLYAQRPTDWKTDFGDTNWKEGETYTMTLKLSGPIPATWEREDLNEGLSGRNVWNKHRFRMYTNIRSGGNKASLSPRTWNFNEFNWNEAVTFTITTNEDDDGENDHFEVDFNEDAHTTAGSYIKGAGRMIIKFPTIVDDDVKGNIVLSTTRINSRDNGQSNNFTVKLNTKPTQDIIVTLRPATGGSIPSDVRFSKTSLTFTPTNYNQAQTITVRTYSDPDTQCDLSSYTLKAGDGYSGQSNLTVYVTDFDNEYC